MARRNIFSEAGEHHQYSYETENDVLINDLTGKVTGLKSLALDMGDEIKYQNTFLNGMSSEFENSTNFLKGSMDRVKRIALSGHNKYIFYLILFSFFVFFMIYIIIKFR